MNLLIDRFGIFVNCGGYSNPLYPVGRVIDPVGRVIDWEWNTMVFDNENTDLALVKFPNFERRFFIENTSKSGFSSRLTAVSLHSTGTGIRLMMDQCYS